MKSLSAMLRTSLRSRLFFVPLTVVIVFVILFIQRYIQLPESISETLTEGIFLIFSGDTPYLAGFGFKIPITWLFINAYIAFSLRTYPIEVSSLHEQRIIIQTAHKRKWWAAKLTCLIILLTLEYLMIYATAIIFSACRGAHTLGVNALHILLAPYLTTLAFSCIQALLNLVTKPIIGFAVTVGLAVTSAYYYSPIAIGNYSMLLRSDFILSGGISLSVILPVTVIIVVACFAAGCVAVEKTDLL